MPSPGARQLASLQEFNISLLSELMQGNRNISSSVTEEIAHHILASGESPGDAWYEFHNSIFSAAMWTSSDSEYGKLVELVLALANRHRDVLQTQSMAGSSHDGAGDLSSEVEVSRLISSLHGFSWTARDLWNGEYSQ